MPATMPRPEIASSWERVAAAGLSTAACPDAEHAAEVDPSGRLLVAAAPVLDALAADLDGSRYAIILADNAQRLIDLRYGRRALRPVLEGVGAVQGLAFTESTTGTNSIATAFELRHGIAVHGEEHYLEAFKRFACYGVPVLDPITKRTAGVLDITCPAEDANDLLKPFLLRGQREIESRLLGMARRSHRAVLDAFERATYRTADPVLAFGDDVTLANDAAAERLRPLDHATLRAMADEQTGELAGGTRLIEIELTTGPATVGVTRVDGGMLVRVRASQRPAPIPRRPSAPAPADWFGPLWTELDAYRAGGTSVLIAGQAGSGRSTAAHRVAGPAVVRIDAAVSTVESVETAARRARHTALLIEELHLLAPAVAARLAAVLAETGTQLVATVLTGTELPAHVAGLSARCPVRLDLPALQTRRDRIPAVAASLLHRASAGRARFTPRALRSLAELDWPGNLRELASVVGEVAARRSAGDVTDADLPQGYRGAGRPQVPGALWQAERDAVVAALRACSGNKVHAAERLGISRTTLYRRLKVLRIDPRGVSDPHT